MTDRKYKISEIANLYSREQWGKIRPLSYEITGMHNLFISSQPDGIRFTRLSSSKYFLSELRAQKIKD